MTVNHASPEQVKTEVSAYELGEGPLVSRDVALAIAGYFACRDFPGLTQLAATGTCDVEVTRRELFFLQFGGNDLTNDEWAMADACARWLGDAIRE